MGQRCRAPQPRRGWLCTLALLAAADGAFAGSPQLPTLRLHPIAVLDDTLHAGPSFEADIEHAEAVPLFGHVIDGRGTFATDFVIDCHGRFFRRVHPHGGRRHAPRPGGRRHDGLDIRVREADFVCYGAGRRADIIYLGFHGETATVAEVDWHHGYGNRVVLERELDGRHVATMFAHLRDVHVAEGQTIERGAIIGVVGKSGSASGPHLHYEKRVDGRSRRLERIASRRF